ncbi:MAG TPA: BlaI/MecI/CopY family transcriptional regulator [Bacteroidales bacterium]|nr:BlaI/MecI/CopY family transcriptional regulator [Bacteroidales bacterium]HPT01924.1 BlaI/MecI/CopY family transcriptional regulator [Bacteroidales bacterium]
MEKNRIPAKELTRAEEEVMQVLWQLNKGFVNDILDQYPEPKPAYNTVSTIVRILEKKGFVDHKTFGKTFEYFPLVSKEDYTNHFMGNVVRGYFDNSYKKVVSFFTGNDKISLKEMEEIRSIIEQQIQKKKGGDS